MQEQIAQLLNPVSTPSQSDGGGAGEDAFNDNQETPMDVNNRGMNFSPSTVPYSNLKTCLRHHPKEMSIIGQLNNMTLSIAIPSAPVVPAQMTKLASCTCIGKVCSRCLRSLTWTSWEKLLVVPHISTQL